MKILSLLAIAGAVPLPIAAMSTAQLTLPSLSKQPDCGCTKSKPAQKTSGDKIAPPQSKIVIVNNCPPVIYTQQCQKGTPTWQYWCASGGIFQTCETSGDNDQDGIFGEAHFLQKRIVDHYTCPGATYSVCGPWFGVKTTWNQNQDECCSTSGPAPSCGSDACVL